MGIRVPFNSCRNDQVHYRERYREQLESVFKVDDSQLGLIHTSNLCRTCVELFDKSMTNP